ncbi:MAG: HD domain-containing protein [Gemmatimonadaceae bacterium]
MLNLATATIGERVQETFRVVERTERTKAGGEPYVVLTLGNATGKIDTEPIWSNMLDSGWADGAIRGALVQVIGDLTRYVARGSSRRQLKLSAPLHALPADSQPLDDFIPHVDESSEQLWDRLDKVRHEIRSERLRAVLALFYDDEPFRLRFERMPASIGGHHSMRGGLLLHVGEVAYIGRTIARAMRAHVDLVVAGALLHDIGKVEAYDVTWDGFVRTPAGFLVGHVVLGSLMLERRLSEAGQDICTPEQVLELQHLLLSHHGRLEYGSPVRPLTAEAEILHQADQASARTAVVQDGLADDEAFRDGAAFGDRTHLWRRDGSW